MDLPPEQSEHSGRTRAILAPSLGKNLIAYVASATAAGVGMLAAGAQSADTEIVYTPANIPIATNTSVPLDLNNDGVVDFRFNNVYSIVRNTSCLPGCAILAELTVGRAQPGNAAWAASSNMIHRIHEASPGEKKNTPRKVPVAVAAPSCVLVGGSRRFASAPLPLDFYRTFMALTQTGFIDSVGPWDKGQPGTGPYLGLKFKINGEVHYGWARLTVVVGGRFIGATLTGYAYETVANVPIPTGETCDSNQAAMKLPVNPAAEPASLGRLAQGAPGIQAWRGAGALR